MPTVKSLWVEGFKSVRDRVQVQLRPITVLAGPNSSGKSSLIQPLLLLKQTLEAPYDPGGIMLDGPNIKFTSTAQVLARKSDGLPSRSFLLGWTMVVGGQEHTMEIEYTRKLRAIGFHIKRQVWDGTEFRPGMTHAAILSSLGNTAKFLGQDIGEFPRVQLKVRRNRFYLEVALTAPTKVGNKSTRVSLTRMEPRFLDFLTNMIHLPGLRKTPERFYVATGARSRFPGTFDHYFASVLHQWSSKSNSKQLDTLNTYVSRLGLGSGVRAKAISDTQLEILMDRTKSSKMGRDSVSIADVGVGVSQVLPILVALLVAKPDQLVYLEQPEIHLHPHAQFILGGIVAEAANRGVQVVVETHSGLFIRGIQLAIAKEIIQPDDVGLNWVSRSDDGTTLLSVADLDKYGTFGDWPIDFDDVTLRVESTYLDQVEQRMEQERADNHENRR
jgi:hypothetical protein